MTIGRRDTGMRTGFRASLPRFAAAGILLSLAGLLMLAFSCFGDAFFPAYRMFSKTLMQGLSMVTGAAPFALWDILAVPLALVLVVTFAHAVARTRSLWRWLSAVCVVVAAMLLFLVGAWGLNHYAPPLAEELGLEVGSYSADELADATAYYLERAASLAAELPRDGEGTLAHQDFHDLAGICGSAYSGLSGRYPLLDGSTAPVKPLLLAGEPLLHWGSTGIFWPFTAESGVPLNCADANLPFTMCHEAAHRLGIASEQEANFAAFLACTESPDARLAYAGYYEAFGYCYNALAANHPERARGLLEAELGDAPDAADPRVVGIGLVFADRRDTYEHYLPYEGPASEVGTAANDAYLKAFSEESGVKSYGQVTDYLIAWHRQLGA